MANLVKIPSDVRYSKRFAVSIAVALNASIIKKIHAGPNQEYYSEYKKVNALLSDLSKYGAKLIQDFGYQAIPTEPTDVGINPKNLSTPLPHKTVATKAGLGWIGKCALLVTEEYGSAVRLTSILTDAELEAATPTSRSRCEDCMICVNMCPGDAPSGKDWNPNQKRDWFFNAHACRKTAKRLASEAGIDQTICGICISVCPWTIKFIKREESEKESHEKRNKD